MVRYLVTSSKLSHSFIALNRRMARKAAALVAVPVALRGHRVIAATRPIRNAFKADRPGLAQATARVQTTTSLVLPGQSQGTVSMPRKAATTREERNTRMPARHIAAHNLTGHNITAHNVRQEVRAAQATTRRTNEAAAITDLPDPGTGITIALKPPNHKAIPS